LDVYKKLSWQKKPKIYSDSLIQWIVETAQKPKIGKLGQINEKGVEKYFVWI